MRVLYGSWQERWVESRAREQGPAVMPWLFSRRFRQERLEEIEEIRRRFTKGYLPRGSDAFQRQLKANVGHDTRELLGRIEVPTLILVGRDDELTPLRMAEELRSGIPRAELLVLVQGGHGLYWEVPDLFNRAVCEFVTRGPQGEVKVEMMI